MYEAQPCYYCKAKSYGMIHEVAAGQEPRHYCERHYWPIYKRVMAEIDKSTKTEKSKQISLL